MASKIWGIVSEADLVDMKVENKILSDKHRLSCTYLKKSDYIYKIMSFHVQSH